MSTIRVNNLQNTSTTDGGISINASGHVTVDGVAMPSSGPLSNRNLIINGDMRVSQRGTSETGVTSTKYANAPDRWQAVLNAGTWTMSQSTEAPAGFANSYKWDCTTAKASLAASDLIVHQQKLEGQDLQRFAKGSASATQMTLSFWVRSSVTGTYTCELFDVDNTRQVSATYSISSVNTWEPKTITFPADTTGAFDDDNESSLGIVWWLGSGTDFTSGTLNTAWAANTNANRVDSNQVNLASSTDNDWYITGVQLEVGSVATPFEHRSYGDELARCQRYYLTISSAGQTGYADSSGQTARAIATICFPTTMRDTPVFSDANATISTLNVSSTVGESILRSTSHALSYTATSSGSNYWHINSGYLTYTAEL